MNPRDDHVVVYEPDQRARLGFFQGWVLMMRNLGASRDLIWQLFKRDFLAGYRQSFLGVLWIFISPFIGIISWIFMNSTGILKPGDVGVPYPVYVLIGSTIWGLFMSFYSSTAGSLTSGSNLILQINLASEVLVIQQLARSAVNFVINFAMILIVLALFDLRPHWQTVFFPLTLIPILFVGSGIGLIVAVMAVVAHDVSRVVSLVLGVLMFLTPVIYAPDTGSTLLQSVVRWNPMTYLVGGARDVILGGGIMDGGGYAVSCLFASVFFMFCWRFFFVSESRVAEKL